MYSEPYVRRVAGPACLWLLITVPVGVSAVPGIDERVLEALAADGTARVLVTVSLPEGDNHGMTNPTRILDAILGDAGLQKRRIGGQPVVVAEIDEAGLAKLRSDERIAYIFLDKPERLTLEASHRMMQVAPVYAQGFTGTGNVVVVLDTGVDPHHEFLGQKLVGEACFSSPDVGTGQREGLCPNGLHMDTQPGAGWLCDAPVEQCAHGTHVAGIATGLHMDTAALKGSGIAKGSDLVSIQIFTRFYDPGECYGITPCLLSYPSDQLEALDYVRVLASKLPIVAVNMSVGGERHETPCDAFDPRVRAIAQLRTIGIATAVSSGNDGYYNAVSAPGCISHALTVGAAERDTKNLNYAFSNTSDLVDFIAPGTDVMSSVPGDFGSMTGTSMAAPHIAGSIALLRSQYPEASVAQMELALKLTAHQSKDPRTGTTLHFPNLSDAAQMLQIAVHNDENMQALLENRWSALLGATRIIIIPWMDAAPTSEATAYELVKASLGDNTHLMVKTSGNIIAERPAGFDETTLRQLEETLASAGLESRLYADRPVSLH